MLKVHDNNMDVARIVLSGLRSIFDSEKFNIKDLAEKYSPQRVGITVDRVNRNLELEALSLILKFWLRRIHLTKEDGRGGLRHFEAEIKKTQLDIIKP